MSGDESCRDICEHTVSHYEDVELATCDTYAAGWTRQSITHDPELVDPLRMGEGKWWNRGEWAGRQTRQKAAEVDGELNIVYNKIPIKTIATERKTEGLTKWQRQWESTDKGALCRSFFPTVEQRLKLKIPITSGFTAIVSDHGEKKSYLHRFKLIDNPMCPCDEGGSVSRTFDI